PITIAIRSGSMYNRAIIQSIRVPPIDPNRDSNRLIARSTIRIETPAPIQMTLTASDIARRTFEPSAPATDLELFATNVAIEFVRLMTLPLLMTQMLFVVSLTKRKISAPLYADPSPFKPFHLDRSSVPLTVFRSEGLFWSNAE